VLVLGRVRAVDTVVRSHEAPGLRVLLSKYERYEEDLAKDSLAEGAVVRNAIVFFVVNDIVFDNGTDATLLDALDVGSGDCVRQNGIL